MADQNIKGRYGLNDAAMSPYLMQHMGREIKLAKAISEIEPTARPMILSIAVVDWPDAAQGAPVAPPQDMPYRINVVYDPAFAQFVFTLHHTPTEDGEDTARIAQMPTDTLRAGYWRAVEAHAAATTDTERADAEREKRLILRALAGRGAGVAE
jgi:hypothetical protein